MPTVFIILLVVAAIIFIVIIANVKVVPQATTKIIERFGAYHKTWDTGIHVKCPFIDRVAKTISLKEKVADFAPQAVITKDRKSVV